MCACCAEKLSKGTKAEALMAYQIAFDMYESATQQFLARVLGEHSNPRENFRLKRKRRLRPGVTDWRMGNDGLGSNKKEGEKFVCLIFFCSHKLDRNEIMLFLNRYRKKIYKEL
jgi:hypothetical protein